MKLVSRPFILATVLFLGALLLTACGDDGATSVSTTSPPTSPAEQVGTPGTGAPVGFSTPASGQVLLGTAAGQEVLTDSEGFTLYFTESDPVDGGTSTCNASCAQVWPPFAVTGAPTGPPEAPGTFGTINRSDGSIQATYNGRPLYRFVDDEAPGDANGDGVGGLWRAVTP